MHLTPTARPALSEYEYRQILDSLTAFPLDSARRQIDEHRRRGDFTDDVCDSLHDRLTRVHPDAPR